MIFYLSERSKIKGRMKAAVVTVSQHITVPLARKFKDNEVLQLDDGRVIIKLVIASNKNISQAIVKFHADSTDTFIVDYDSLIKIPPKLSAAPYKCKTIEQVIKSIHNIQTLLEEEFIRRALRPE